MIRGRIFSVTLSLCVISIATYAISIPFIQDNNTRRRPPTRQQLTPQDSIKDTISITAQPIFYNTDTIPDSLLHTRWPVQRTVPITDDDLNKNTADLQQPDNVKQNVEYNDTTERYIIGAKIGGTYINAPIMMTPDEYKRWSAKQALEAYFRSKNDEIYKTQGKEKFDFSDMHFDLGPAEKIFGPGGVRIRTQGTAELRLGATMTSVNDPSLPIRNRNTTAMNFDEKVNLSMNGTVGDKVNLNMNYNTDATFDFDTQNLKLRYEGKDDEIIKLVEAGNVSFPANSSLIKGASSLFGIRTDLQFGKLKMQLVASQKKSTTSSVSSKGGVQLTPFDIDVSDYEENRHFFLSQYFRDKYDAGMKTLPNLMTGININRVEIWVTNKTGTTANSRDIVAFTDLGENQNISNPLWSAAGTVPSNNSNTEYNTMVGSYSTARDINQTNTVLGAISGFVGGKDYEKLARARLLSSSEYTVNTALGYVSLNTGLQTDQVLAVAYEYTYGGMTYQVGEFASDITDVNQALFVKSLKNTSNNPAQGNWKLMMKNVYYLASSIQRDNFRLDVKYQSDTTGVYLTYIPEQQVKDTPLLKTLGADRLDNNNKPNPNGYFDYVEGYTVNNGRVFLPETEPFGSYLYNYLINKGVSADVAAKYAFNELYANTKTQAKQIAEKDKFRLQGAFRGTLANVISLGATNVPQGSVVVTAGGVTLMEGADYSVNYSAGEVTIINQSIVDAGTPINVSLESNTDYGQTRKTMFGLNWEYDFSKNLQLSGTVQHLSEQALTNKVTMGSEPLNNTLWGLNLNWKKESQWLTNMLDKIPFLHLTAPSNISFNGEFAQLIAGQTSGVQSNASYIDDFENTTNYIDVSTPASWIISSTPSMFEEHNDKTKLTSGFNRSLMAWYNIDPLFTNRNSSLTPPGIKGDLDQLSNYYVREVYTRELYPNKDQSTYNGTTSTLPILNLAYYPNERGPYNFNTNLNSTGQLNNPTQHWGGMMRKLDTNDFDAANVEYVEFWMLDPFIYTNEQSNANEYGGDFYINLGEVSEDILTDGQKFSESGISVDGINNSITTQWGMVPQPTTETYAFATSTGSRALQDVGFNGLSDKEEQTFADYQSFLTSIQGTVNAAVFDSIMNDPANDNYHYFRGSDYDQINAPILRRYKYINNPEGNSPDADSRTESYDTSYKSTPDVEDINQDYTLNENEQYYQYHISMRPEDLAVGKNFIVDKRETQPVLRNGTQGAVATWYLFRVPLTEYEQRVGSISDFSSIRFMRMFLTGFQNPIVLRFGSLDLVRGEWRIYDQQLDNQTSNSGTMAVSSVNIEENNDKTPVNYVLPPGITRSTDPTQPQLVQSNEQALNMVVTNMGTGESKCVYKSTGLDLRNYKRVQMFVHANAMEQNTTNLTDNQLSVFIRLGSDYKNNYYEYEIPLKLTSPGRYDAYSQSQREIVWPVENMLDIPLSVFTDLKNTRNKGRGNGTASYTMPFSGYDNDKPNNKVTVMGNPSLGNISMMIIGVRNNSGTIKSGEIWVNELRLMEYNNSGGWAAHGNLNVQLSDLGMVNVVGQYTTNGFGGLEDGVSRRAMDDNKTYSVTTNLELGKFFPEKAKVSAPLYYSVSKEEIRPKYNPLDTDVLLSDAINSAANKQERDSIQSIAVTKHITTNFSLSNVRVGIQTKRHPMPYDPANFSFTYSHSHSYSSGQTTVYEREDNWRGALNYSWTPVYKAIEPFKAIKSRSKWYNILKRFGLNWLPQNITFNSEILRNYAELQERDMLATDNNKLPLTFNEQFLWNRDFSVRWDITKNIHLNFQSATHAEIEEPYTPINKALYPDKYKAWKDSVWTSIKHLGTPLDYNQNFSLSYQLPLNLIPIFDWINSNATYNATYNWMRGTDLDDGTSLGNSISNNRDLNINGSFDLIKLYNHIPFLKKTNDRFNKETPYNRTNANQRNQQQRGVRRTSNNDLDKELPKNQKSFEREITLLPDTTINVSHGKNTKRLNIIAKTESGKTFKLKFKRPNVNTIRITNRVDSATKLKITVTPKEPLDNKKWYKTAQSAARVLMMVRDMRISYHNQYAMSLPGFMPNIGDFIGQGKNMGLLSPGLGFAFGLTGDSYIQKAKDKNWLLMNDSVATPATTNKMEDLQLHFTLEPIKNLKIDLDAARTTTKAKSMQYMYAGNPTTESGTFTMTTISIGGAFEGTGNANNGFNSPSFNRFCNSLDGFRNRVEAQYANSIYPQGTPLADTKFDPANGTVNKYGSDVMIPAFIASYTSIGGHSLSIFPTLAHLLPNWSLRYSGLSRLPWFRDVFRSVNINHAYKSIFAIGSYNSYSTYMDYMNGLGFISDPVTTNPIPSSMYNVPMVSINESFSPLLGIDLTFYNNLTTSFEYRTTRILSLSMTSVQINEATSHDWVVGMSYRINNFNIFAPRNRNRIKSNKPAGNNPPPTENNAASQTNYNLNLRLDLSLRKQANIIRDIATVTSTANSGNTALKLSFLAEYTLSRMLTMSFFYDRQSNTPLLSSNSYPTITNDFGLSLKFSLTR